MPERGSGALGRVALTRRGKIVGLVLGAVIGLGSHVLTVCIEWLADHRG